MWWHWGEMSHNPMWQQSAEWKTDCHSVRVSHSPHPTPSLCLYPICIHSYEQLLVEDVLSLYILLRMIKAHVCSRKDSIPVFPRQLQIGGLAEELTQKHMFSGLPRSSVFGKCQGFLLTGIQFINGILGFLTGIGIRSRLTHKFPSRNLLWWHWNANQTECKTKPLESWQLANSFVDLAKEKKMLR